MLYSLLTLATGSAQAALVTVESESATVLGASFITGNDSGVTYISSTDNHTSTTAPGLASRVASYSVTFLEPGNYELYARIRVGAGGFDDDSMFYATSFGSKTPTLGSDWVFVNGLAGVGYTADADVVAGGGSAGNLVWKWINLSAYAPGGSFNVTAGSLTQAFQIGGREDGLDINKFVFGTAGTAFTVAELGSGSNAPPVIEQRDLVTGNMIQFNDNGTWCWFQDERAVVDTNAGKLVIGSVASASGTGGTPREGDVEAALFDLASGTSQTFTLKSGDSDPSAFYADDHNAPGILVLTNGGCLAIYAGHNTEKRSYYRVFNGADWSPEQVFDWNTIPGGADFNTTYSNPHYMATEGGRIYNFSRGHFHGSPNLITSDDNGQTWTYRGVLATNENVGYVNGYFQYWGNGVDRIDFICTEYHPDNFNTSIYHGYVSNGMSFRSDATLVDGILYDQTAPRSIDFTTVFAANTILPPGQTNTRCWTVDVGRYSDGTVAALVSTRVNDRTANDPDPDHAFFYVRWNGSNWTPTYLGQAGKQLYVTQKDYTGLGALCPDDPNTLFISTPIDPRDDSSLAAHEIFKGVTTDNGASWTWTPMTWKSVRDNLRPIVPAWDANHRVVLWWRGTYTAAQNFDAVVVGIIDRTDEVPTPMTYVDATSANTTFSDGSALTTTGPSTNAGAADNQWHQRAGLGNGDSVLTSAETGGENAPALRTTIALPGAGTYDLWANFWGKPGADWRIQAGLATNQMQILRQMACKQVESGAHTTALLLTNVAENAYLYQAYVGRATVANGTNVSIYLDDEAIAVGTTSPLIGDFARTWYDGVSYANTQGTPVPIYITQTSYLASDPGNGGNPSFTITWQSVSNATYTVQKKAMLQDPSWNVLTNSLPSGGKSTMFTDKTIGAAGSGYYRVASP